MWVNMLYSSAKIPFKNIYFSSSKSEIDQKILQNVLTLSKEAWGGGGRSDKNMPQIENRKYINPCPLWYVFIFHANVYLYMLNNQTMFDLYVESSFFIFCFALHSLFSLLLVFIIFSKIAFLTHKTKLLTKLQ